MDRGTEVTSTFNNRLAQRAAGAAALGAVFTLPVTVDAGVVYSGPQNISAGVPLGSRRTSAGTGQDTVPLNLDNLGGVDFSLRARHFNTSYAGGRVHLINASGNGVVENVGFEGKAFQASTASVGPSNTFAVGNVLLRSVGNFGIAQ